MNRDRLNRREFLHASAALTAGLPAGSMVRAGTGDTPGTRPANEPPSMVQLDAGIEPLVVLIETTPRERLIEEVAARIREGLSYQEVLSALLLAGARNIQPRPHVGFRFHALMVIYSAHLASMLGPDADRWLPLFWSLDYFKTAQARDREHRDWSMRPVDESAVPRPTAARQAFIDAMERWDEDAADAAIVGLARSAGANEIFELLCRYGTRDFRDIGHKAIYVANGWRTLQYMGRQHAEVVLRSIVYALLNRYGHPNPGTHDLPEDRPGRENRKRAERIPAEWMGGRHDPGAVDELLGVCREGSAGDASQAVVDLLNRGIGPESVWEGLFSGAGELVLRRPGIISLHTMTCANAIHYAWQSVGDDHLRRQLMLQMAAFLPMFRDTLGRPRKLMERRIDQLTPVETRSDGEDAVQEVLDGLTGDPMVATGKSLYLMQKTGRAEPLIDAARGLVLLKADNTHDYKLNSALAEDHAWLSNSVRARYIAASTLLWCKPTDVNTPILSRIQKG